MTSQFQGFDFVPEEESEKVSFEGFDFVPEEKLKPVKGIVRQGIKTAKEIGAGIVGLGGDLVSIFDAVANKIEDVATDVVAEGQSEEFGRELRRDTAIDRAVKGKTLPIPTTAEAQKQGSAFIQDLAAQSGFDLDVEPQTSGERVAQKGVEFLSTAPLLGGKAIPSFLSGAGAGISQELGFGPVGEFLSALAGHGLGAGVETLARGSKQLATEGLERSTAKTLGRFIKPDQIRKDLIAEAKRQGVDLPAVAKIDNDLLKWAYTKSLQSGLTGDELEKQLKKTTETIVSNIKKVPKALGGTARESHELLGKEIQQMATDYMRQRKGEIGELFDFVKQGAEGYTVKGADAVNFIERTIENLKNTLVKGREKKETIGVLEEALKMIETEREAFRKLGKESASDIKSRVGELFGDVKPQSKSAKALRKIENYLAFEKPSAEGLSKGFDEAIAILDKPFASTVEKSQVQALKDLRKDLKQMRKIPDNQIEISVNRVIETIKDINDIVNFENFGGTNKLLLKLKKDLNGLLEPFKKDDLFGRTLDRANKEFGDLAAIFQSDKQMARLMNHSEGKGLVKLAQSPEGFERLMKTLPKEGGETIRKDLTRTLVEDAILKPMVDKRGNIDIRRASNVLSKADSRRLIKHLVGEEQFKKLQQSQKFAQSAADSLEKFMNFSQSGVTVLDAGALATVAGGVLKSFATMNPVPLMLSYGPIKGMNVFTSIMANPELVDLMIEVGKTKAVQGEKAFLQNFSSLLKPFTQKLAEVLEENDLTAEELGFSREKK